jgi:hypothetical protein
VVPGAPRPGAARRPEERRLALRPRPDRAVGLLLVLLAEVLDERVERLALALLAEHVADRLLGLVEGLLRGLLDLRDLEDVVAELRLDRPLELTPLGREDGVAEVLVLLALGEVGELAALALGGLVDRHALGDGPEALAALELTLGLVGLRLGLGDHHVEVAALGLGEALLVLLVVLLDVGVGDLRLVLGHLLRELGLEGV